MMTNPKKPARSKKDGPDHKKELQELLGFMSMAMELSTHFINLPPAEVDKNITHFLQCLVEFLHIERSSFIQIPEEKDIMMPVYVWSKKGYEPEQDAWRKEGFPYLFKKILRGEIFSAERLPDDLPEEAHLERAYCIESGIKSNLTIPLKVGGEVTCAIFFGAYRAPRSWPAPLVHQLACVGDILANAIARKEADQKQRRSLRQIKRLSALLEKENVYFKKEIKLVYNYEEIIGQSPAIKRVLASVEQVAKTDSTVLIQGKTGTGKELLARATHNLSPRKDRAMVKVNCAALPAGLVESELFGREKGAYTGALTRQVGRFEIADGSTIFLDEIGELPLETQVKLLRVLQEGQFERLGSVKTQKVDIRFIAATNRNLAEEVRKGNFREDLYYRLSVFPITVPPLNERREDIPQLIWYFVKYFGETMGKNIEKIPRKTMEGLKSYPWPGNVRELRNIIEHAMIVSTGKTLKAVIPGVSESASFKGQTMEEIERAHITDVLEKTGWRIRGKNGAAEILGLKPTTLHFRMQKLGIKRP